MIRSFKDKATEDIFDGTSSKVARRVLPPELHRAAAEKMDRINSAVSLQSLSLPGLRLKALRGDREGQHSIRINGQFRICFYWTEQRAEKVEIVDYH